jgi:phosphoglycerate dehydrogenase-like enzyme
MTNKPTVLVQGAESIDEVPGLERIAQRAELRFAATQGSLSEGIRDAEIVLGWDFRSGALQDVWANANALKWIQWSGAGVDAIMFDALRESDVVLTNVAGVFDKPMAEFALATILAFAKHLPENTLLQQTRTWKYRLTEAIDGKRVLIVGAGNIGTCIGQLLKAVGMQVVGLSRRGRANDPVFGTVHPLEKLNDDLANADYVVLIPALTAETRGMFGAAQFEAMKNSARFLNLGRGALVDEAALVDALNTGSIAGAGLDVFSTEPLPDDSPLWGMNQVIVSPHMSGDLVESPGQMAEIFLDNFDRYLRGETLRNMVDKQKGYAAAV